MRYKLMKFIILCSWNIVHIKAHGRISSCGSAMEHYFRVALKSRTVNSVRLNFFNSLKTFLTNKWSLSVGQVSVWICDSHPLCSQHLIWHRCNPMRVKNNLESGMSIDAKHKRIIKNIWFSWGLSGQGKPCTSLHLRLYPQTQSSP